MSRRESLGKKLDFGKDDLAEFAEERGVKAKVKNASSRIFSIVKLVLGICLLPGVYSATVSFIKEFGGIDAGYQNYFISGVVSFLVMYLFVWEAEVVYVKGQEVLETIFVFFKPLVKVAPYVLPISAMLIFGGYWGLAHVVKSTFLLKYFLFFFGFSLGLHLVFGAKTLQHKPSDFLKANYIFGFSLIYIICLVLAAFCFNLIFEKFSFVNFFNNSFQIAKNIFDAAFKQLFL